MPNHNDKSHDGSGKRPDSAEEKGYWATVAPGGRKAILWTPTGERFEIEIKAGLVMPDPRPAAARAVASAIFPALSQRAATKALRAMLPPKVK